MTINKESINKRFNESVIRLTNDNKSLSKKDIAEKLNIGASKLSEILNNRMGVSVELLTNFCLLFDIDIQWMMTGVKSGTEYTLYNGGENSLSTPETEYMSKDDNRISDFLVEENEFLKKQIRLLETVIKEKQDIIDAFRSGSIIVADK